MASRIPPYKPRVQFRERATRGSIPLKTANQRRQGLIKLLKQISGLQIRSGVSRGFYCQPICFRHGEDFPDLGLGCRQRSRGRSLLAPATSEATGKRLASKTTRLRAKARRNPEN